jgi:hypothetical protein
MGSLHRARPCAPRGAQTMIGNCHQAGAAANGGSACVTSGSPRIRSSRFRRSRDPASLHNYAQCARSERPHLPPTGRAIGLPACGIDT